MPRPSICGSGGFRGRVFAPPGRQRVYSATVDRGSGLLLNSFYPARQNPATLRRIRHCDTYTDKSLVFLTIKALLPVLTIYPLYKSRWKVDLFFKPASHHLRIKRFCGTSENAVCIWTSRSIHFYRFFR